MSPSTLAIAWRWIFFAVFLIVASPLHAQGYCAQFNDGSSPNCGFATLSMCEQSVTGVGGVCLANPSQPIAPAAPPLPPLPLPPGQTSYQLFPPATAPPPQASSQPPCNPVIDGTYCASASGGTLGISQPASGMGSIQSISSDLGIGSDPPATLGGITFSGGTTCIGLFRQMSCGG
jgi:hypothetical protein